MMSSGGNPIIQKVFSICKVIVDAWNIGQRCGRSDKICFWENYIFLLLDHCHETKNIASWTPVTETIHLVMHPETGFPKPKPVFNYQAGPV